MSEKRPITTSTFTASSTSIAVYKQYLQDTVNISLAAWQELEPLLKWQQLPKKERLVTEGQVFNQEVFIVAGVIRAYTLDEQGHERTTAFYQARDFMNISTLRNQKGNK